MAILFSGHKAREQLHPSLIRRLAALDRDVSISILFPKQNTNHLAFLKAKEKEASVLGIQAHTVEIPADATVDTYRTEIEIAAQKTDGVVIQLPVANSIDTQTVLNFIPYEKDVEALSTIRIGEMMQDETRMYSPVAKAAIHAIDVAGDALGREPVQQKVCVIGYNNLTGRPAATVLSRRYGTVTICRSQTPGEILHETVNSSDIVISSTGRINIITPDMVKEGSILVDVGFERGDDGKIHGDFHPECEKKAAFFTPVPGGLGPLTVTYIYDNLLSLLEEKQS